MRTNGSNLVNILLKVMIGTQCFLLSQTSDDTLDVAQGYETLNLAVSGDTPNPNRVYRLERGGVYLLNGAVSGLDDQTLRIVAADGDGPRPQVIPAVDSDGGSSQPVSTGNDAEFKGL